MKRSRRVKPHEDPKIVLKNTLIDRDVDTTSVTEEMSSSTASRSNSLIKAENVRAVNFVFQRKSAYRKYPGRSIESIKKFPYNRGGDLFSFREMSLVTKNIVIGGRNDAENMKGLLALGVTHVLNASQTISNKFEQQFIYENIPILDSPEVDIKTVIPIAIKFLKQVENIQGRVLVHCVSGVSRSVMIVMLYFLLEYKICLKDAFDYLKSCRPIICPNDGFKLQLAKMEVEKFGYSTVCRNGGKYWDFYEWNSIRGNYKYMDPSFVRSNDGGDAACCVVS